MHEEALRILLQLIGRIDPDELSALISLLLTSASRPAPSADLPHATSVRAQSVRAVGGAGASPAEAGSGSEDSDEADDGPTSAYRPKAPPPPEEGDEDAPRGKRGAPDGVRSIYAMIARKLALHGHTLEGELPELGRLLRRRKGERGEGGRGEGSGGIREAEGGAHGGG